MKSTRNTLARPISRRSFLSASCLGIASIIGLSACGQSTSANQSSQTQAAQDTGSKVVRFGAPSDQSGLIEVAGIAQKEGFIDEELQKVGYTAQYTGFAQAGPALNEAFSSSAIDFATYGDLPALTALSNGVGLEAVANINSHYGFGIAAGTSTNIASVADLKGKRVVVPLGTPTYLYLLNELKAAGLKDTDIQAVNSVMDGPTLVASQQAEAYVSITAMVYATEAKGVTKVIATSDDDPTSANYFMFARKEFAAANPDATKAVIKALRRAFDFAKSNYDKAITDLSGNLVPEDVARKIYTDPQFPTFDPEITDAVRKNVEATAQFMSDYSLVKQPVDLTSFYDTSYLDETRA